MVTGKMPDGEDRGQVVKEYMEGLVRGSSQRAGVDGDLGPQGRIQLKELGPLGLPAQTGGQLILE